MRWNPLPRFATFRLLFAWSTICMTEESEVGYGHFFQTGYDFVFVDNGRCSHSLLTQLTMPTYEYRCEACSHQLEEFQSIKAAPLVKCPECGKKKLVRLISGGAAIVFKGSGFYQTDYRSDSYNRGAKESKTTETTAPAASTAPTAPTTPPAATTPTKTESKPA